MKIVDKGVVEPSYIGFTIPSKFAINALYYVKMYGHYHCNKNYCIERDSSDPLLIYICSGFLYVESDGQKFKAGPDQIILLDGRNRHKYFCIDSVEFLWFHFQGCSSLKYIDNLLSQHSMLYDEKYVTRLKSIFTAILKSVYSLAPNEHYLSQNIGFLLGRLAAPDTPMLNLDNTISPSLQFISEHFDEEIHLEDLASLCCVSVSHLIRSFKLYTSYTPHEYILYYRIRQAKQLLTISSCSIEEIAERCGFNSASHFARAFRKAENISPTEFRNNIF